MVTVKDIVQDKGIHIKPDQTVSEMVGEVLKHDTPLCYCMDEPKKKCYGIFSPARMLEPKIDIKKEKVRKFVRPVHTLSTDDSLQEALRQLYTNNAYFLPVFEKDTFRGIVTIQDIMKHFNTTPELARKIVQIETHPEIYTENTPLDEIYKSLRESDTKQIPIVSDSTKIRGIVDHQAIIQQLYWRDLTGERAPDLSAQARQEKPEQAEIMKMPVENFIHETLGKTVTFKHDDFISEILTKMLESDSLIAVHENAKEYVTMLDIAHEIIGKEQRAFHITYSGLNDVTADEFEKRRVQKIAQEFAEKYVYTIDNNLDLDIHVKEHEHDGTRRRYEIHSRATYPGSTVAAQGQEWELIASLRESLEGIEQQLKSKYKDSNKPTPSNATISDELST
jgi:CBS domain-containing protein